MSSLLWPNENYELTAVVFYPLCFERLGTKPSAGESFNLVSNSKTNILEILHTVFLAKSLPQPVSNEISV